jgi:hypothetical protein
MYFPSLRASICDVWLHGTLHFFIYVSSNFARDAQQFITMKLRKKFPAHLGSSQARRSQSNWLGFRTPHLPEITIKYRDKISS